MINENTTFALYGYYPLELPPKSHKIIMATCNGCGKVRNTSRHDYRDLCLSCAQKRRLRDLNWQIAHKVAMKKLSKDPKWRESVKLAAIKRSNNPKWKVNNKITLIKAHISKRWNHQVLNNFIDGEPIQDFIERPKNYYYNDWRNYEKSIFLNDEFPGCGRHHYC